MQERGDSPGSMAVEDPSGRGEPSGSGVEESVIVEERTTAEPSSRATTMSPRPQSSITAGTSPASMGPDTDANKNGEAAVSADPSLSRVTTNQSQAGRDSSVGRRSPEQTRNAPSRADSSEMIFDDELYAPSIGTDYPSLRVSFQQMPVNIYAMGS